MAENKKITQFNTITDAEVAKDANLWVIGNAAGQLHKPTIAQLKKLINDIAKAIVEDVVGGNWDEQWQKSWDAHFPTAFTASFNAAFPTAFNAAFPTAFNTAFTTAFETAFNEAWDGKFDDAWDAKWSAAKSAIQTITAKWTFNQVNIAPTTNSNPIEGDVWYSNANNIKKLSLRKTLTEDIVTSLSNDFLKDVNNKERLMSADGSGQILATYETIEEITIDGDIITECDNATNSGKFSGTHVVTILPAGGTKTMYKGQKCKGSTTNYFYIAINDNTIIRLALG